jgi:hypothetical protein
VTDRIRSAATAAGRVAAAVIAVASFVSIAIQSIAQIREPQVESGAPRPEVSCHRTYDTREAKATVICIVREPVIGSVSRSKSLPEQQQELREELQRRADERRRILPSSLPSED